MGQRGHRLRRQDVRAVTKEEIDRLYRELQANSIPNQTLQHDHDKAFVAYCQAVVQFIDERVPTQ